MSLSSVIINIDEGLRKYYECFGWKYDKIGDDGKFKRNCEENGFDFDDNELIKEDLDFAPQDCIAIEFAYDEINNVYHFPLSIASYSIGTQSILMLTTGYINTHYHNSAFPTDLIKFIAKWYDCFKHECVCQQMTNHQQAEHIYNVIKYIYNHNGEPPAPTTQSNPRCVLNKIIEDPVPFVSNAKITLPNSTSSEMSSIFQRRSDAKPERIMWGKVISKIKTSKGSKRFSKLFSCF